jgi:hypothetical protein
MIVRWANTLNGLYPDITGGSKQGFVNNAGEVAIK